MQTTEEKPLPLVDRLKAWPAMLESGDALSAGTVGAMMTEAADEIEDLQGRNFVNRNAIKFMREKLDRYKAALELIAEGEPNGRWAQTVAEGALTGK